MTRAALQIQDRSRRATNGLQRAPGVGSGQPKHCEQPHWCVIGSIAATDSSYDIKMRTLLRNEIFQLLSLEKEPTKVIHYYIQNS